jgi:nicotinate-nucleotide pyrophosphorylase (carboxylating)
MNHRRGLYDMAMLKDNHLAALPPAELARRLEAFRRRHLGVPIEFEAKTHAEVESAARLKAEVIMLDNMRPSMLRREIAWLRKNAPRVEIEISGGLGLHDIRRLARLGPDRISIGRITHSAPALDISLELEPA